MSFLDTVLEDIFLEKKTLKMAQVSQRLAQVTPYFLLVVCLAGQLMSDAADSDPSSSESRDVHLDLGEGAVMGNYEAGKTQMMTIQRDSEHPRYGTCWTNALEVVSMGCKRLTDDEQSRMALTLTNCHLAKAGIETHPCNEAKSLQECLHPIKDNSIAFNAYTEFFTHTQDICFFLQSQVWHEHTEMTVEKLAQSSEDVAEQLEVTGKLQESMIEQQNQSLKNQEQILAQEAQLKEALKSSTNSIHEVFAEMKSSTLEQKALFAETFDRVAQVQKLMLGEFTWFNSVIYFVVIILFAYMLTSTQRTAGARFGLFLLFLLNWVAEWMLFQIADSDDQTMFHTRTWTCRKLFCIAGFLLLVYNACRYRDYDQINHRLLLQIQKHLQDSQATGVLRGATISGAIQGTPMPATLQISAPRQLPAIKDTRKTEFSSDGEVDATFRPENITSSESHDSSPSEQSFHTRKHSTASESLAGASVQGDRLSTPISSVQAEPEEIGTSARRRRGRPKGSRNMSSRDVSPAFVMSASRYNLRHRGPSSSPNPVLDLETSMMFAQAVESLASRNYVIQPMVNPSSSQRRSRTSKSPTTSAQYCTKCEPSLV